MTKTQLEELRAEHDLLRSDPHAYIALKDEAIRRSPSDATAYFERHLGWYHLKRYDLALADLDKSIALEPDQVSFRVRGELRHELGNYARALADFNLAEAMDLDSFEGAWGPLYRANCHARLGNLEAALADCARLAEDHWSPGLHGAPAGGKQQVIEEIRRRAAAARGEAR